MLYHETPFYVISTWCRLRLIEAVRFQQAISRTTKYKATHENKNNINKNETTTGS
jgi:hypothetical protein